MVYSFDGFNYLVKLNKGDRLMASLEKFAEETKLEGAWVSGLGGASEITLGFYDLDKKEYQWQTFEGLHEIMNLTGSIAFNEQGEQVTHLHGVFGDRQYNTKGGHVKDLTTAATVELFIHRTYKPLKRKFDSEIGLPLLDL